MFPNKYRTTYSCFETLSMLPSLLANKNVDFYHIWNLSKEVVQCGYSRNPIHSVTMNAAIHAEEHFSQFDLNTQPCTWEGGLRLPADVAEALRLIVRFKMCAALRDGFDVVITKLPEEQEVHDDKVSN